MNCRETFIESVIQTLYDRLDMTVCDAIIDEIMLNLDYYDWEDIEGFNEDEIIDWMIDEGQYPEENADVKEKVTLKLLSNFNL